jgi:hypothetical protein
VQSITAIDARGAAAGGRALVGVANAAMWALARSGVRFRTLTRADGTLECWRLPRLPEWEVPMRNSHERRPRAPDCETLAAGAETAAQAAAEAA